MKRSALSTTAELLCGAAFAAVVVGLRDAGYGVEALCLFGMLAFVALSILLAWIENSLGL